MVDRRLRSLCDEAVHSYQRAGVLRAGRVALVLWAGLSIAARPYHDTKERFSLELAPGWEMAPQFGDTLGMVFKKLLGRRSQAMALFMVRVAPPGTAGSRTFADATEQVFASQPGFRALGESRARIGGQSGFVRRYQVQLDRSSPIKKQIDAYFLESSNNVYLIHVETTVSARARIDADVTAMLASFRPGGAAPNDAPPPAGVPAARAVAGRWINDDGLILVLDSDGTFALAEVGGHYEATADTLTLIIPNKGRESFTYVLAARTLTLRSPNLPTPMTYRRVEEGAKHRTATDLVGAWKTVGTPRAVSLELKNTGRFVMGEFEGKWRYEDGRLHLERSPSEVITYDAKLDGDRLILAGADLDRPIALKRR